MRKTLALLALALAQPTFAAAPPPAVATPAQAKEFIARVNADLKKLWVKQATADWVRETYITDDSERLSAFANEEVLAYLSTAIKDARRFNGVKGLDADTARSFYLLKLTASAPAPDDVKKREELAALTGKLDGMYGKGKYCKDGKCRTLQELEKVLKESHNYDELLDAWQGWHSISRDMRPLYARLVELGNEGAKEIDFANLGDLWRSGYDMPPADFEKETDRLFQQVKPLYENLHCYARSRLQKQYGKDKVPDGKPIPAHLLGNMWAQTWENAYPALEPYPGVSNLDVESSLKKQSYDAVKMAKTAESFFTSLGLDPLPSTFWERSMLTKPRDREVVCHASAWDVQFDNDLRIKMCIETKEEDLITLHHELGHDYYFHAYYKLPVLFQQGANDGFHEAIGDTIALSITPAYLKKIGLLDAIPPNNDKAVMNELMKRALEKVAFLPFGKLIDQWRWDVFSGKTKPDHYNQAWWELRKKYQGVAPGVARSEADFDPGAKYHIPANVPYTRYFLSFILQFQFHRALCKASGFTGPLHECSIFGNKEAGKKLQAMLAMGASKPWPDALEAMTGSRQIDATAILDYFAPLNTWLKDQNKGQKCGW